MFSHAVNVLVMGNGESAHISPARNAYKINLTCLMHNCSTAALQQVYINAQSGCRAINNKHVIMRFSSPAYSFIFSLSLTPHTHTPSMAHNVCSFTLTLSVSVTNTLHALV